MRGAVQQGAARFAAVPLQGLNLRAQAQLRYRHLSLLSHLILTIINKLHDVTNITVKHFIYAHLDYQSKLSSAEAMLSGLGMKK